MSSAVHTPLTGKLNQLLQLHNGCLIRHMQEAQPQLSAQTYTLWQHLKIILHAHQQQRVQMIMSIIKEDLDISPDPSSFEQNVAFAHFLNLEALLPQMLEELRAIHALIKQCLVTSDNVDINRKLESIRVSCQVDLQEVENTARKINASKA